MTAPQGSEFQLGWGFESTDNQPATIGRFLRPVSAAGLKPKRSNEDVANLEPNGQALKPVKVKAAIDTTIVHQPDVDSIVRLVAHHAGNYKITNLVTAPTALTAALAGLGAGLLDTGVAYTYKVTFVTAAGETEAGTASNSVSPTGGDGQVALSAIPLGETGVTARKIYRTEGGGSTYKLLTTIANNTVTTFADNVADGTLTTTAPSTSTAGAYSWALKPESFSGSSASPASMSFEGDQGDGYPVLTTGNRMQDIQLKVAENKITNLTMKTMGCHDTYMADAVQVNLAGTYAETPKIRGHRSDPTSTDEIKVKVIDTGALDGTATVSFTKGATAYGATTYGVTAGQWFRVILADGSLAGHSRSESLEVMFPPGNNLTQNDEWSFESTRTAATASYSSLNPLTGAGVEVTIDGTTYNFHSADVSIVTPRKASFTLGSMYAQTIQPNGKRQVTITFDRDYEDRTLLLKLISAGSAAVVINMYGDKIGAFTHDELWQISVPYAVVVEQDQDVTNENTLPEKIVLKAYRSGSTPSYTHTIQSTLSSI